MGHAKDSQPWTGFEVAVVGMAGRFPGAQDPETFWRNLQDGLESISRFTDEELESSALEPIAPGDPRHVKAGGVLAGVESFDAAFFGMPPKEAQVTDPQHRILLECAHEALESSGHSPESFAGDVGVYVSAGANTYLLNNVSANWEFLRSVGAMQVVLGNDKDYLASRISYKLNLKGPSVTVQSACSSSLVAVHTACRALLNGECDLALAGGVSVSVPQKAGYLYQEGGVASPDGHCRPFDAQARGTVKGNGAGVVVLKRLGDALEDRDTVLAIIKGSAINNDGASKLGFTAPSVEGQARVIRAAHVAAEVDAETLTYVEAHGTATALGDPIELAALTRAFRTQTQARNFCALGSVKANVGHLDAAAGVTGLIKVVLALRHRQLPPSLHFTRANPAIDFDSSPFRVNTALSPWETGATPRRAGVSSFGIGGTNAHVVLEEAPAAPATEASRRPQLLRLSARTGSALQAAAANLARHLRRHPEDSLADVAYTLQVGRRPFHHRMALPCASVDEALQALESGDAVRVATGECEPEPPSVAFLFPGQGTQSVQMMAGLYRDEPVFHKHVRHCAELLGPHLGLDLREVLYPREGQAVGAPLDQTWLSQPALFVVEHALARLWMAWGVRPQAMLGHSIGEYVAACLAEVLSLEDALALVAARGRLMQQLPRGAMLAVPLPEERTRELLGDDLSLAAVNRSALCVVSGPTEAVERLERQLGAQGLCCQRLQTSHAFHSHLVEPALEAFTARVKQVPLRPPRIPYLSNVTGTWITPAEATSPDYWAAHLRRTVRFSDGVAELLKDGGRVLLEVGPGQTLTSSVRRQVEARERCVALASLPHPKAAQDELQHMLHTAGRLWCLGAGLELPVPPRGRRIPLPTYPFERQRYWVEPRPPPRAAGAREPAPGHEAAPVRADPPGSEGPSRGRASVPADPPRTPLEQRLASLWQEALGVEGIGIHESFFALGGDSLVSLQLCALANRSGLRLHPQQLLRHPTLAQLAEAVSAAPAGQEPGAPADLEPLSGLPSVLPAPESCHEPFPLTDIQQAYWIGRGGVLDLGEVASHVYQELEGDRLEVPRLEAALRRLIDRHPMLRAVTTSEGQQRVLERVPPYPVEVLDLRGQAPRTVEARLEELRQRMSHQVLPSDRWPLFEVRATLLDGGRVRLHISVDILFADAWSLVLYSRDLLRLYREPEAALPPLELTFRDHVLAEAAFRDSDSYRRSREYWLKRLPTLPAAPALPLARPPGAIARPRFTRRSGALAPAVWTRLKSRAAQAGLTPSMVLCAAYAEVLALWSKSPHFCINLPVFNRPPVHPQVNDISGDFTSVILLEVPPPGREPFEALARRLQQQLWSDLEHRHFSGVSVMRELARSEPSRAVMPVVFTSLIMPGAQDVSAEARATFGEEVFGISQTPQVWLDHQVAERAGGLTFNWDAVEELFPADLLQEMFDAYRRLLDALANDEESWRETRRAPRLLPTAQGSTREAANATAAPIPAGLLHSAFFEQAERRPSHPAVLTASRTLTYGELALHAGRVAHQLRRTAPCRGALVAIVMEKGWEQVAAALGVLRAGAAYVPIDPSLPRERLEALLEHARACVVLTQPWVDERLSWPGFVTRLHVSDAEPGASDDGPLEPLQEPGELAYVIYTSGTTGLPKGVMIDHRGALNTVTDINHRFGVGPADRVLALSSLSFDLSVYDLFGALGAGATLVMPDAEAARDPAHWAGLMTAHHVTVWNSVPALLELLVQHAEGGGPSPFGALRLAMLSGDWIPVGLPARVRAQAARVRLISLGGATEASIWSIGYPIDAVDPSWTSIPYGKPLANQRFHVLDANLAPRPVWVPGELFIGGVGLALGYWRNEADTQARFIHHPDTGERLYRTGDLGRLLPDGNIEFLGREDFQVKVQGHRIELGEVEGALARHEAVASAVVVAAGARHGNKRLVAYVVPHPGAAVPSAEELRRFLAAKLAEYMVPPVFVLLDALPLTSNGKVDRRALPAPDLSARAALSTAPRTPVEVRLAKLWTEVLGVERAALEDHFFEQGGDSLLATKLLSRLRAGFQVELPLRTVFETPTLGGLARHLEQAHPEARGALARPIRPAPRTGRVPLSSGQQRLWFHDRLEPGGCTYNVQEAVRLTGAVDAAALERGFNELVRRHEVLRTTFTEADGEPAQVIAPHQTLELARTDLRQSPREARQEELRRLLADEAATPFDLARGPLLRARLLRLDEAEQVLVVTLHHIVSDAWSIALLIHELTVLYGAFTRGAPSPLEPLPLRYADFAEWEREGLRDGSFQEHLVYWKDQLQGPLPVLQLPVDTPHAVARSDNGARHPFKVPAALLVALKALCQRQGVTLFMGLLAAWQTLLCRSSGQEDILVGTPIANRERPEVSGVMGFFVNTLVMRTRFSGDPSFREVLGRVREAVLGAHEHQALPYDKLVEELRATGRNPGGAPLFRVWFVLQNVPMPELALGEAVITPLETHYLTAVHDLKLGILEGEDGLHCAIDYRTHLFKPVTIARMVALFEHLLRRVAEAPETPLRTLVDALDEQERRLKDAEEQEQRKLLVQGLKSVRRQATRIPPTS
ncbi:non-ribosomal peptide synthetase/type I polyketide synthase [Corallococcus silvisoli]|uniref:non-ribosomal peptide synthetase/type I polyketide synthase n=1 Tax=Corallococcus silvisoli TaxID=2697031 RepID=UPI00137719EA|nr:non-ribosomal peptide synthetase/type I polyketide synthase [Corallococcus silvisoli]NBD08425.1 amino acid adenylation domain-containing protein [Corallococcus silvisoli]